MASTSDITPELITQLILDHSAAPNTASAQLRTVLRFLKGLCDQNAQAVLGLFTDDIEYSWVAKGFDQVGPRVKDRKETEAFFTRFLGGNFVKDYRVSVCRHTNRVWKINVILFSSTHVLIMWRCPGKWCCRSALLVLLVYPWSRAHPMVFSSNVTVN